MSASALSASRHAASSSPRARSAVGVERRVAELQRPGPPCETMWIASSPDSSASTAPICRRPSAPAAICTTSICAASAARREQVVDQRLRIGAPRRRRTRSRGGAAAASLLRRLHRARLLGARPRATIALAPGRSPAHSGGLQSAEYRMRGSSSSTTARRPARLRPIRRARSRRSSCIAIASGVLRRAQLRRSRLPPCAVAALRRGAPAASSPRSTLQRSPAGSAPPGLGSSRRTRKVLLAASITRSTVFTSRHVLAAVAAARAPPGPSCRARPGRTPPPAPARRRAADRSRPAAAPASGRRTRRAT